MIKKKYKIFISATEQSGDNIGFNIINELLKSNNQIFFEGVGGSKMSPFLSKKFYDLKDFNSMGIIEIIFSLKKYLSMINYLTKKILINNYDLIITIDSPDFHYPIAKKIKKNNSIIKLIHIVAPSVWAWRKNRAKKFANVFNELLILYSFEKKYFIKYNLKTTFIGNPIHYINPIKVKNHNKKYIAFLPGSRMSELNSLLPYFKIAYEYLLKELPNSEIFFPTLPHLKEYLENYTFDWKLKTFVTSDLIEIDKFYSLSSHALVCSGTASLEIAKRNIPQLVIYKLNIITEIIGRIFVNIKFANILNIMDDKMIIPEITNSNLNPEIFIKKFKELINSKNNNLIQISNVNRILKTLQVEDEPFKLASNRINNYLN